MQLLKAAPLLCAFALFFSAPAQAHNRDTVQAANHTDRWVLVIVHDFRAVNVATFCVAPKGFAQQTVPHSVMAVTLSTQKGSGCGTGNYFERTLGFKQPSNASEPMTRAFEVRMAASGHLEFSGGGY